MEIGEVAHLRIFAGEEPDALFHLLGDAFLRLAIGGAESLVVAIGAATPSFRPVAVRAGESRVDGYFLDLEVESLPQEIPELPISFRCFHGAKISTIWHIAFAGRTGFPDKRALKRT